MADLTDKQQRFVREYLKDLNATKAAIRAGYEWRSATGFYVYFLVDPCSGSIFYVGKGKGRRVGVHSRQAKRGQIDNPAKVAKISELLTSGFEVQELIFAAELTEADAYALERQVIRSLRDHGLTNISGGIVSSDEAVKLRARLLLSRVKPFGVWISECPRQVADVKRMFGDHVTFYNQFVDGLNQIANQQEIK